jgi:hypothetical protein
VAVLLLVRRLAGRDTLEEGLTEGEDGVRRHKVEARDGAADAGLACPGHQTFVVRRKRARLTSLHVEDEIVKTFGNHSGEHDADQCIEVVHA